MTGRPARVLLVGDGDVVVARIEAMLRDDLGLPVLVGPAGALGRLIEEHNPPVVVLASTTARIASILGTIAGLRHPPPIVLLVDDPRAAWTTAARRTAVRAVLDHDAPVEEISAALTAATAGLIALHPDVFRTARQATASERVEDRTLTARELEILEMLAEGVSNQTIAQRLHISTYTVKFHVASILAKLGAASRTEAVTLGVRRGLISL